MSIIKKRFDLSSVILNNNCKDDIMRRIFINARFLSQTTTGVQRYAIELIKALNALIESRVISSEEFSFILLAPQNIKFELNLKHIELKRVGKLKGHLWEQIELPFHTRTGLLLNLCNTGPLLKLNQIVTIHDAAVYGFPQAYSFIFRTWYKLLLKSLGIFSRRILTVSFFSKKELMKYFGIREEKLQVIYLGKEHIFATDPDDTILQKHSIRSKQFVLAVSSMNPNKNFHTIVKAIELLGEGCFDIVIAGGTNPRIFGSSDKFLFDNVKYAGYVSDAELRSLYEHAACFVFPSYYEGFGLPPLEAMSLGCPVIVSNIASLPEVCGNAALYCDPSNPQNIANKIRLFMDNAEFREDFRQKGLERIQCFSWEQCAEETWTVIMEVLAQ